jgi:imidazole glycerol-phosphate synthase subunit HisF
MLAKRIIPCLDVNQGRVVKGQQFKSLKDVADPATLALRYSLEGADELVFYDITASADQRKISHAFVSEVARQINIPFCVGGGISSIEDMTFILRQGADKVSVNTAAVLNPSLIQEGALKFGSQCIVLSIDAKKDGDEYYVYTHGGRQKTTLKVIDWALQGVALGAGELVLNTMDTDGEQNGYDTALIKAISDRVSVPVIASGGAGRLEHFIDAAKAGAEGLLAASVFHFETLKIKEVKEALYHQGIPVRRTYES